MNWLHCRRWLAGALSFQRPPRPAAQVFIFTPQLAADGSLQWQHYSRDGNGQWQCSQASQPREAAAVAVVPAEWVSLCSAELAAAQRRYANKVAPFLVEESLAEGLEQLHLVPQLCDHNRVRVAVISHLRMAALEQLFSSLGVAVEAVVVDADLLDSGAGSAADNQADRAVAATLGRRTLVKTARGEWWASTDSSHRNSQIALLPVAQRRPITLPQLAALACQPQGAINLLVGRYRLLQQRSRQRQTAATAAVIVALLFLLQASYYWALGALYQQRSEAISHHTVARFSELYPDQPLIDLQRQLSAKARQRHHAERGLSLLAALAALSSASESLPAEPATLSLLRRSALDGTVQIQLQLSTIDAAEQLAAALEQRGLAVTIDQIQQLDNDTSARFTLRRGPP